MTLSTHVLDVARGEPAAGISIALYALAGAQRTLVATTVANADGRTDAPLGTSLDAGEYEIVFGAGAYFAERGLASFYGDLPVRVVLTAALSRYHVPLLLAPWGYSTYRGS